MPELKDEEKEAVKEAETEEEEEDIEEKAVFDLTNFIFEWSNAGIVAVITVVIILTFFFRQVTVSGPSMTDTLQDKDRLIVQSFMYTPQCGDIVVIDHAAFYDDPLIKRVIAVGGQKLNIDYTTGEVSVDGVILHEDYIKGKTIKLANSTPIPDVIPEGYVFVMGDNREGSLDSRSTKIDLIPVENIIGKAIFRMYPFDSIGGLY